MNSILRPKFTQVLSTIYRSYKVSVLGHGNYNPSNIIMSLKRIPSVFDVSVHDNFLLKDIDSSIKKHKGNAIVNLFENDSDIGKCLRSSDIVLILVDDNAEKMNKDVLTRLSFYSESITQTCKSAVICVQLNKSDKTLVEIGKELRRFGGFDERNVIGIKGNVLEFVNHLIEKNDVNKESAYKLQALETSSDGVIKVKEIMNCDTSILRGRKERVFS